MSIQLHLYASHAREVVNLIFGQNGKKPVGPISVEDMSNIIPTSGMINLTDVKILS